MEIYGDFLQSHYRAEYFKYYILPNFKNVFKVFEINEYKEFNADANTKSFFTSTDRDHYDYRHEFFKPLTAVRQVCDSLAWIVLILSVVAGAVMVRRLDWSLDQKLIVAMLAVFVAAFSGASTIAAPINNFRYMMPVFYEQIAVPVLVISAIVAAMRKKAGQ